MWRSSRCTLSTAMKGKRSSGEVQKPAPAVPPPDAGALLLSSHNDYVQLMQALRQQMPPLAADETVVFINTAPSHHAFAAYACLDHGR